MPRVKVIEKVVKKKGAPAYMVSFGDMMTLILCFFILLVAMSEERNYGLLAKGLGSFVVAIESFGLNGVLSDHEKQGIFDDVRRRFNLPPEEDPERRDEHRLASSRELLRAEVLEALKPHRELHQPRLAKFAPGSWRLHPDAQRYIASQADSLRPARGQVLVLEGHAAARGGPSASLDANLLAFRRAAEVRDYLMRKHDFAPDRVEARAWLLEIDTDPLMTEVVHARLVIPNR